MSMFKEFVVKRKDLTFLAMIIALIVGISLGPVLTERVWSAQQGRNVALLKVESGGGGMSFPDAESLAEGFGRVARKVEPSVVNVSTTAVLRSRSQQGRNQDPGLREFFGDEFWERFFGPNAGPNMPAERKSTSLGSGVIVDPSGYILTNYHVIAGVRASQRGAERISGKIEVRLQGGETFEAKVIGEDPQSDLTVLKINSPDPLPAARIGDTSKMQVGDWVLAIGNPFGFGHTVTSGIVSATGRVVPAGNIFGDYIQTDTAINPGNSGGPLVNMRGEVVGINTLIFTRSGGSQGIGFAIPSTVFVNAYNQIVQKGRIERGWLGVSMNLYPMTGEMAEFFGVAGEDPGGVKDGDGVLITELIEEDGSPGQTGPAYRAGIRAEDVIVRFGDREIETDYDLRTAVASTPPGEQVPVTVVRGGQVLNLEVTLAERTFDRSQPDDSSGLSFEDRPQEGREKEIGLEFETLSPRDAERMGLGGERGVRILNVAVGSLADEAGLVRDQVVTHVNGSAVTRAQDLYDAISRMDPGAGVVLRVVSPTRDEGRRRTISYVSFVKP